VAAVAGQNLKKVVLELGGSDPFIVLDGTDLPKVAKTAAAARMENGGQACNASKRMIVAEAVYDDFFREFTAAMSGVTPDMRSYREELFGPAAVVYKVADADEAVELANSSAFGLGGAVFSSDERPAAEVADRVGVGMVWIKHRRAGRPGAAVRRHQAIRCRPRARTAGNRRVRQQEAHAYPARPAMRPLTPSAPCLAVLCLRGGTEAPVPRPVRPDLIKSCEYSLQGELTGTREAVRSPVTEGHHRVRRSDRPLPRLISGHRNESTSNGLPVFSMKCTRKKIEKR